MTKASINELIGTLTNIDYSLLKKVSDICEKESKEHKNVMDLKSSELLIEAFQAVEAAETENDERYNNIIDSWEAKYGKMGAIYLQEFLIKLMTFMDKFCSYSKRVVCVGSIIKAFTRSDA